MNDSAVAADSLRQLADEIRRLRGGQLQRFPEAFDRIVRDNSSYYVLAYYPPNPKR